MKKTKVMLMAIAGGVLVFKAKSTTSGTNFCITDPSGVGGVCETFVSISCSIIEEGTEYAYTAVGSNITNNAACANVICPQVALINYCPDNDIACHPLK